VELTIKRKKGMTYLLPMFSQSFLPSPSPMLLAQSPIRESATAGRPSWKSPSGEQRRRPPASSQTPKIFCDSYDTIIFSKFSTFCKIY
jgi:hypothetical protein